MEVPGALSVFADQASQRSDATGTTVQFTFDNGSRGEGIQFPRRRRVGRQRHTRSGSAATGREQFLRRRRGPRHPDRRRGGRFPRRERLGFYRGRRKQLPLFGDDGSDILRGGPGPISSMAVRATTPMRSPAATASTPCSTTSVDHYYATWVSAGSSSAPPGSGRRLHPRKSTRTAGWIRRCSARASTSPTCRFTSAAASAPTSRSRSEGSRQSGRRADHPPGHAAKLERPEGPHRNHGASPTAPRCTSAPSSAPLSDPLRRDAGGPDRGGEFRQRSSVVGKVAGFDLQQGAALSYSLLDDAGGRFAINASSGAVTVANGALLDYEYWHSNDIIGNDRRCRRKPCQQDLQHRHHRRVRGAERGDAVGQQRERERSERHGGGNRNRHRYRSERGAQLCAGERCRRALCDQPMDREDHGRQWRAAGLRGRHLARHHRPRAEPARSRLRQARSPSR